MSCDQLTDKREKCHYSYGKLGEDCLVEELEEKRCLAFKLCPREAQAYYGTVMGEKGLCGSWAESFCFGKELLNDEDSRDHHRRAQKVVNDDRHLRAKCRAVTLELSKCLMAKYR